MNKRKKLHRALLLCALPIGSIRPVSLSANDRKDTHILREGATLGRNISTSRRSSSGSKRIDLNISPTATGVSRKHIKIVSITPDAVTILQDANVQKFGRNLSL